MNLIKFQKSWKQDFMEISKFIEPSINGIFATIVHVGSTSIDGAIAKPIIDIDLVIEDLGQKTEVISRLASIGYVHRGDLGIEGREAFFQPTNLPEHHLYLVHRDAKAYLDHIDFQSALQADSKLVQEYNDLKKSLEHLLLIDRQLYTDGKTDFILKVLNEYRLRGRN